MRGNSVNKVLNFYQDTVKSYLQPEDISNNHSYDNEIQPYLMYHNSENDTQNKSIENYRPNTYDLIGERKYSELSFVEKHFYLEESEKDLNENLASNSHQEVDVLDTSGEKAEKSIIPIENNFEVCNLIFKPQTKICKLLELDQWNLILKPSFRSISVEIIENYIINYQVVFPPEYHDEFRGDEMGKYEELSEENRQKYDFIHLNVECPNGKDLNQISYSGIINFQDELLVLNDAKNESEASDINKKQHAIDEYIEDQISQNQKLFSLIENSNIAQSSESNIDSPRAIIRFQEHFPQFSSASLQDIESSINNIIKNEIESYLQVIPKLIITREVDSSNNYIEQYLESMLFHILAREDEVLDNLNTPIFVDPLTKLARLHSAEPGSISRVPRLDLIVPEEVESLISNELNLQTMVSVQIYLQLLSDCANEALNLIRPYGMRGIPDP